MGNGAVLAAAVVFTGLLTGCGSGADDGSATPPGPPAKGTVVLRDIAFKPDKITIEAGDTVTWRFADQGISHDVVADDESFKSDVQDSGTFRHTFETPGTYAYKCSLHPVQMTGTVVVR
ncbi:MAG TPA: plastocyanin/azurin family copper-binding protein [Acidimicrobiales bacterium]|nr:plastocyanin/azurin family copper-binding protein [Acidimicrobiales bacterium]